MDVQDIIGIALNLATAGTVGALLVKRRNHPTKEVTHRATKERDPRKLITKRMDLKRKELELRLPPVIHQRHRRHRLVVLRLHHQLPEDRNLEVLEWQVCSIRNSKHAQRLISATHDPNYQTLAGIGNDCFEKKGGGAPAAAPAAGKPGMAATHDPNYQTLAGLDNNVFAKKDGGGGAPAGGPSAPADQNAKAATHDPNYQTLAGLNNNVFEKKDGGGAAAGGDKKPIQPADKNKKAATQDPNYQTLAAVGGDVFGADKKGGAGGGGGDKKPVQPADKNKKAATMDPNYQTLAAVGGDVFGADKKKK
ncbi:hypothetical protein CRE_08256 [Caenorhabditis remanei]|uniref:Uncharacterized protein n=1 Tax=Caenorhabditis remanei TaxID=31234 RepID=E3M3B2_CAERE|nr:hypothetical protein CRE_08256 [Caenorhabditis remanei]